MLKKIDWVPFLFLTLTPLAALILTPFLIHREGWHWSYLVSLVTLWAATSFSITGGYHRFLAHRSYEAASWVKFLYLLFGAASFQGSALKWCSDHRQHHRFVDTVRDPYNIKEGFWFAHIGWLLMKSDPEKVAPTAPDLEKDVLVALQDRYYVLVAVIMGFGFPLLMGWAMGSALGGLVFGGFIRIVVTHHCTFFINSLCHTLGRQPYSDNHSAKDSFLMAIFTFGEGYHNFHHEFQADYRNAVRWYQWDPTKWSISALALVGSARKLRRTSNDIILKARLVQDEKRLEGRAISPERLIALKARVEGAQEQLKIIHREYLEFKNRVHEQSRDRLIQLKGELKIAKIEFRGAYAQWKAYVKMCYTGTLKSRKA